jgi:integrase
MAKLSIFNKKEKQVLLVDFIYSFISKSKRGYDYKRRYRNLANHIKNFQSETGIILNIDNMTEQIFEEFIYYLKSKGRIKGNKNNSGLMTNTIRSLVWNLKLILKRASQRHNIDVHVENINVESEEANTIYLTLDELDRLNNLTGLSKEARAVRDRFLLGCFTALRFSDYSQITSKNIMGDNIEIKTRKTGARVIIPMHRVVREILQRNNGEFPPLPSQQSFGATIKRLCKRAGIIDEILYERTIGLKVVRKRMKKYTLVSSHTARRTGATNMYLAKIPTFRIMLLTGHTTEESFFKYIRISKEENAKILSEHPFFK